MASVPSPSLRGSFPPVRDRVRVQSKFFFRGEHKFFLKGITYGPFHPDAAGDFVGTPEKVRADLALMRELGVNLLRVYHVPPRWFMDLLADAGLFVLISIPWAEHVEFLNDRIGGTPPCSATSSATKSPPPWSAGWACGA